VDGDRLLDEALVLAQTVAGVTPEATMATK